MEWKNKMPDDDDVSASIFPRHSKWYLEGIFHDMVHKFRKEHKLGEYSVRSLKKMAKTISKLVCG